MKLFAEHKKYKIFLASNKDRHFYCQMGRFFSSREVIKELEGPIYDADIIAGFSQRTVSKSSLFLPVETLAIASGGLTKLGSILSIDAKGYIASSFT